MSYLIEDNCKGVLDSMRKNIEILRGMVEKEIDYCFFDPEKLAREFSLIEM